MAEPEAMKPSTDRRAVNLDFVTLLQFKPQLVQRQIAPLGQSSTEPLLQALQLANPTQIALAFRLKPTRLPTKLDHIVHELR